MTKLKESEARLLRRRASEEAGFLTLLAVDLLLLEWLLDRYYPASPRPTGIFR